MGVWIITGIRVVLAMSELFSPEPRSGAWVDRSRLAKRMLSQAEKQQPKLTIVTAPPGYGKSALIHELAINRSGEERLIVVAGGELGAGWFDGREIEGDILECMRVLVHCIEHDPDHVAHAAASLFRRIGMDGRRVLFVIDDFDDLTIDVAERLTEQLLVGHAYSSLCRMIVMTRSTVDLPFASLGRRGEVRRIARDDLAFTRDEIAQFIAGHHGGDRAAVDRIWDESHGWPLGVQLADSPELGVVDADTRCPTLDAYVRDSILGRLAPSDRAILLAAHDLPLLTSALWEKLALLVAGDGSSFSYLASIIPMTISESPLRDRPTFVILPQVRKSLGRLAVASGDAILRGRILDVATSWLIRHGLYREAGSLTRTGDQWRCFLQGVRPYVRERAIRDDHGAVISALADVPHDELLMAEDLAFWHAVSLLSTGEIAEGVALCDRIAMHGNHAKTTLQQGREDFLRALAHIRHGSRTSALAKANAALDVLPEDAYHERFRAAATAEVLSTHAGDHVRAGEMFELARRYREQLPWDQRWWLAFVLPNQADRVALAGNLPVAFEHFRHQLESSTDMIPEQVGLLRMRMALIELEWNDLASARALVDAIPRPLPNSYWMLEVALTEAKILHAEGHDEAARAVLYAMIREASRDANEIDVRRAKVVLAQIWIDSGMVALAEAWDDEESLSMDAWPRSFGNLVPASVKAQLRMAQGQWDEAHRWLDALIAEGERRQQLGPLVRCYALKAYAYAMCGDRDLCHRALHAGLVIGARTGFHRSFLVGAFDVRSLLVSDVVATPATPGGAVGQVESRVVLTDREREVLVLASRGLTNAAIADRMFLSSLTVKNHLARVYRKLAVRNRTDAVVVATSMGLLWEVREIGPTLHPSVSQT